MQQLGNYFPVKYLYKIQKKEKIMNTQKKPTHTGAEKK